MLLDFTRKVARHGRAVLCRLRGDCITAMIAGRKSSSLNLRQLLGLIRTVLYSMSYRRENGGPGGSCNLTMTD